MNVLRSVKWGSKCVCRQRVHTWVCMFVFFYVKRGTVVYALMKLLRTMWCPYASSMVWRLTRVVSVKYVWASVGWWMHINITYAIHTLRALDLSSCALDNRVFDSCVIDCDCAQRALSFRAKSIASLEGWWKAQWIVNWVKYVMCVCVFCARERSLTNGFYVQLMHVHLLLAGLNIPCSYWKPFINTKLYVRFLIHVFYKYN